MGSEGTSDKVTQREFIEGVLIGGKRRDALLQLAITASSAPWVRASDTRRLGQFVSEVLSILRSPINPFEGMLEAPSPIVRLYQAHRETVKDLQSQRYQALEPLLRDALTVLYGGILPIAWATLEAAGIPRNPPPDVEPADPTQNL